MVGVYTMNKMTKEFVHKHKKILYIQRCLKNIKYDDYVNDVLDVQTNPMIVKFETLGEYNKNKNICLFENRSNYGGFFAVYRHMLDALYFSERFHFTPVVDFGHKWLYAESEEVNGTKNPFEYYFDQVSSVPLEEAYNSFNVVRFQSIHANIAEQHNEIRGYRVTEEYIHYMAELMKKYIRFNSYIKPRIENDSMNILNGKKTLGIHVRGTDFNIGMNGHPVMVEPSELIGYIKNALEIGFDQIFIATDDNNLLEIYRKEFGEKIVYFKDTFRSSNNIFLGFSQSSRAQHQYLLGYEVLRDMYTLAKCDGLLSCLSSVTTCARITKASLNSKYEYINIIDKGLHKNNRNRNKSDYVRKIE
jgi:hypothetical protein